MIHSYYMPSKVLYGPNCVVENSKVFKSFGDNALIVTTPSSARNGALDDVFQALTKEGMTWKVFDRCENNPSIAFADRLGEFSRTEKFDLVIGIGGGSAMDAAKAACVLSVNDYPAAELFKNVYNTAPLPLVTIPTTAGTGAEITYNAVLTIDGGINKKSFGTPTLFAKYAMLDARYTEALPMKLARYTALDALGHAVEGYLSSKATPAGTMVAKEIFRVFAKHRDELLGTCLSYETRFDLLVNAMYSGIVIAQERTIGLHSMSYPMTALFGVQHGQAVALPMAAFIERCYEGAKEKIDVLLDIFGLKALPELFEYIGALIDEKPEFTRADIDRFVEICAKGAIARSNPVTLTEGDVREMYEKSLKIKD